MAIDMNKYNRDKNIILNDIRNKLTTIYNSLLNSSNENIATLVSLLPERLEILNEIVVFSSNDELNSAINDIEQDLISTLSEFYINNAQDGKLPREIEYDEVVPILTVLLDDVSKFKSFLNKTHPQFENISSRSKINTWLLKDNKRFGIISNKLEVLNKIKNYFNKPEFAEILPEGFDFKRDHVNSNIKFRISSREHNRIKDSLITSIAVQYTTDAIGPILENNLNVEDFVNSNEDLTQAIDKLDDVDIDNIVDSNVSEVRVGADLNKIKAELKEELLNRVISGIDSIKNYIKTNPIKRGIQPIIGVNALAPNGRVSDFSSVYEVTADGILAIKTGSTPNFRRDWIVFPEEATALEFTTTRHEHWFIYDLVNQNTASCIGFRRSQTESLHLRTVDVRHTVGSGGGISLNILKEGSGYDTTVKIENPFGGVPAGSRIKFIRNNDCTELKVFIKRPTDSDMHLYTHFRTSDIPNIGERKFRRMGLLIGVSASENIKANEIMKNGVVYYNDQSDMFSTDVESPAPDVIKEFDLSTSKIAVLVVAGQSNAVGYDESTVDSSYYVENSRIKQLGIHGEDNLKVIPLIHCAQSFQDMRRFKNSASPDFAGTKGVQYPLAKLITESNLIPEDYTVVVISAAFGGTEFEPTVGGEYDPITKLPKVLSASIRWNVDSPWYKSMKDRISYLMSANPANKFLGVVWIQGESDQDNTADANGQVELFNTMYEDFNTFMRDVDNTYTDNKFYPVDSCKHWRSGGLVTTYDIIWGNYRNKFPNSFVAIDINTPTNAENGTGATSSNRNAHYGNDAYRNIIAPAILDKMKLNG